MKDGTDEFCKQFEAHLAPSKRIYRRTRSMYAPMYAPQSGQDWYSDMEPAYEDVPMVEVTMPVEKFDHLIEVHNQMNDSRYNADFIDKVIERERHEHFVRSNDPRVEKAYQQYKMLLNLVEHDYK